MSSSRLLLQALEELAANPEQSAAVRETGHCVVLAGPGSGKTKTLTTAMARALAEDVVEPRGVACITYNNECAIELEMRLARLGMEAGDRVFVGTVHGFALSQVIAPYARCVPIGLPADFRVAKRAEMRASVEAAYAVAIAGTDDPHRRWSFASEKRRRDVDRTRPEWRGRNPELAMFIEAYEFKLRQQGLIDFDDMPLLAYRMIKEHDWIRDALRARFPILFVDEYQDLGHALHELVLLSCFGGGIRLFAVGDADQSIYGFTGANPELLEGLTERPDVRTIRLRFNYRSGRKIVRASLGALGEERDYRERAGAPEGELTFWSTTQGLDMQARAIAETVVPKLVEKGIPLDEIAVLYRAAYLGDKVADALKQADIPFVRTDGNALVRRSSRLARFIEDCARWVVGGWRDADPRYSRLIYRASLLVFGRHATADEERFLSEQLIGFLQSTIGHVDGTHAWLQRFDRELISSWRSIGRNSEQEWDVCVEMIANTDPASSLDMPLGHFAGRVGGTGRVNLSTLHSVKGREFDAVVMYGVNARDFPSERDKRTAGALRETRRLFYVGVTRPRKELGLIFQENQQSPWVNELYQRSKADDSDAGVGL
ncbi:ATP-dependent helicase [Methylobacterium brachiatum]|uniref:ATP-dependent helicase n=1 Tax=Methylobacterium sp. TaxID=409 RepID=UPI0006910A17|nr:ATP-dependent helicase [Methylobacterium sp.]MBN6820790.1 ATP-dependent helicase [Methylobacterium organophilum]OXE41657.1 ATP-dependent helicase [Methylobacterium radiotolerans]MBP29225.1 ATP-dependent helicase [Methylobacterium sp.]RUP12498.1 MAG: ATP-dependent helicase [Methylobacterium sp.]RUP20531.1 MAG: ATP-dependent helicase [Methylobacterium sp.]